MRIAIGLVLLAFAIVCGVFLLLEASEQKLEVAQTIGVGIDHASNAISEREEERPLTLVRTHLKVDYPSQVELGSSANITVTVTQTHTSVDKHRLDLTPNDFLEEDGDLSSLKSDVAISLRSGSLDWETLDEPKTLQQGSTLPATLSWSPGTKSRGIATVYMSMDVFDVQTKEDQERPPEFRRPKKKAASLLGFLKVNDTTLALGQEVVPLEIRVTQYGIFDDVVYWGTLFGGILSFFGAAVLLGWSKQLLKWIGGGRRAPALGLPDPSQGPDI